MASLFSLAGIAWAEERANYDEAKVGSYTLPDPLVLANGRAVADPQAWRNVRRPELLQLFRKHVYGARPSDDIPLKFTVVETTPGLVNGKGTRKRVRIDLAPATGVVPLYTFTMFVPSHAAKPVPAFVGMHLFDSAADNPQPGKLLEEDIGVQLPGTKAMEVILDRGYAVATLDAQQFCADDKKAFRDGALSYLSPGKVGPPDAEESGAIGIWAWGLSRALDYLQTDPQIDGNRVAVIGHSRMGKTALWAGAQDERFAIVISNNSGCGGAALSRRDFGETVERINRVFPHWFCGNFKQYGDHEDQIPVDQHELVALSAPRPVYIASAVEDHWADPRGEFLAAVGADPVYRLLGRPGLGTNEMPPLNKPIGGTIGYHIRSGKHALTDYDWLQYLDFADRHYNKK